MPNKICRCPTYNFPHREGGGKCELPGACSVQDEHDCPGAYNTCPYQEDCLLLQEIYENQPVRDDHPSLTAQERNQNFRSW